MTEPTTDAAHERLVAHLTSRWPEHRVGPGLGRIQALTELLGDPQHSAPVIHVGGTNGKGSTAAMIDALLRARGLRTGRFASPHVSDITERINIDGEPISHELFAEVWADVEPYVQMVDERRIDGIAMTFFEVITGMAFAAFADAPVDVIILEVGLGGTYDATNVADGQVAVITPIDLDHTHLLGSSAAEIAAEKAGIIKPGAQAILAGQSQEVAGVLLARCAEVGALPHRDGIDFGLIARARGVGGQVLRLQGGGGPVEDVLLPLHGEHQAHNAALALAAVEAFGGMTAIDEDVLRTGLADVHLPGRLEVVRRAPTIVLDGAHNPHGARAAASAAVEAFAFQPCIGVVASMADKDTTGVLEAWAEVFDHVICTQPASTGRAMPAEELADLARQVFAPDRVLVAPRLDDALDRAVALLDVEASPLAGVIVTGSIIAVGEARNLLGVTGRPESGGTAELSVGGSYDDDPLGLAESGDDPTGRGGEPDPFGRD
ncbi:bifunctional folylpolyglutamate synthase/dihydrofolate synthase [Propionibacteriaceae bacterium Y2011]